MHVLIESDTLMNGPSLALTSNGAVGVGMYSLHSAVVILTTHTRVRLTAAKPPTASVTVSLTPQHFSHLSAKISLPDTYAFGQQIAVQKRRNRVRKFLRQSL